MRFFIAACAAVISCWMLGSCASFISWNPPLAQYDPSAGYRFAQLERGDNSDDLFVIVTLSGGGKRAAALAYGVLEALRDTTVEWNGRRVSLLDEVDVISSVSGGSFPAAYYALYGRRLFDKFPDDFLYRPIQSELINLLSSPVNWIKLSSPNFGRSDLVAEFYDREIFDRKTYADVIARNRRPYVILNATDMTTGAPFNFVQDQFDLLCSDLAGVSLGRAVAASSAFPVLLTPLTFQNYAGTCGYKDDRVEMVLRYRDFYDSSNRRQLIQANNRLSYTVEGSQRRSFIHLLDGGITDNIGLRTALTAASSLNHEWSLPTRIIKREIKVLVMIVVNAANIQSTERDKTPAIPSVMDTLIKSATIPLDNYSVDSIELMSFCRG